MRLSSMARSRRHPADSASWLLPMAALCDVTGPASLPRARKEPEPLVALSALRGTASAEPCSKLCTGLLSAAAASSASTLLAGAAGSAGCGALASSPGSPPACVLLSTPWGESLLSSSESNLG